MPSNSTKPSHVSQTKELAVSGGVETFVPPTLAHKSSEPLEEDLVLGLCPEDFSFSLHDNSTTAYDITASRLTSSSNATSEQLTATEPPKHNKNITSSSRKNQQYYPIGTFYGLPTKVLNCLTTHRGITKLYGQFRCDGCTILR